jgi:hypothetical protein
MRFLNVHLLAFVGLLARLAASFVYERIDHPDEIFQYLEQAHRLTFGYGYVPWEYRFGTRSWIVPGSVSLVLAAFEAFGIDDPAIYRRAVQIVFCVLSVSLVYSGYIIAKEISGEMSGRLAGLFIAVWYELVYHAAKPNPEILASYLLLAALAVLVSKSPRANRPLFGVFAAGTVALRMQYLPAIAMMAFFACRHWGRQAIAAAALTFVLSLTAAGWFDYLTWGGFWLSYYNNYLYNAVYGISELFGTETVTYYVESLTAASLGVFAFTAALSFLRLEKTAVPLATLASIIIPHSLIPHKEYRFVFAAIPMFLILLAILLADERLLRRKQILFAAVLAVCCLSLVTMVRHPSWRERKDEILEAYLFLNKDPSVAAILNMYTGWHATGGYYYLHRNVPIYSSDHLGISDDLGLYVSHIICPLDAERIPGFSVLRRMKTLEIRRQTTPPGRYATLDIDNKNVLQAGVDDRFTPTVKNRLSTR